MLNDIVLNDNIRLFIYIYFNYNEGECGES